MLIVLYGLAMAGSYAPSGFNSDIVPCDSGFQLGLEDQPNNFREWFSWSVIASVASAAGLVCHVPTIDVNQTDIRVETYGLWNGAQRSIRIQAKASSSISTATINGVDYVTHSLKRARYDALQQPSTNPIFLVLIAVPPLDEVWVSIREACHVAYAAAWWGQPTDPSTGNANQTVRIPSVQRFDVAALQTMMEQA